ncbi:histidine kinase [Amycolatopsis antarctica]|uniref:histidine kinase n=1 Tax=Amycolatopsis antarctica TaxID=1854586 RepID=A0A263CVV7_9PSEU|nr:histidine kinase [Amycolatopsis antarctica]
MTRYARRAVREPFRRRTASEFAWVLLGVPVALLCLCALVAGFALGVLFSPVLAGIALLAGTLRGARLAGRLHRTLAGPLLGIAVPPPVLRPLEPGIGKWTGNRLGEPASWRAVAYLLLRVPMSLAGLALTVYPLVFGAAAATYPLWWFLLDGAVLPVFDLRTGTWLASLPLAGAGLLTLLAVPWVLHGIAFVDRLPVRGLLGPATLSARVRELERSRAGAVDDAAERLRRIERDLHDGAQAHLVAVAMKLGIARDALGAGNVDLDQVRALVTAAHGGATRTLTELRDLARGIRPAGLDAGLGVALSTVASQSAAGVTVDVRPAHRPAAAVETILYFAAVELLANAAKHAGAVAVRVLVREAGGDLVLTVTDEGHGGARLVPGGGLDGLVRRVGTVDGRLDVHSPAGGPTVVTIAIPDGRQEAAAAPRGFARSKGWGGCGW